MSVALLSLNNFRQLGRLHPLVRHANVRLVIRTLCRDLAHLLDVAIKAKAEVAGSQISCVAEAPSNESTFQTEHETVVMSWGGSSWL